MPRKNLKNKPLVEAILELKWTLSIPSVPGFEGDPHYRLLLGRISERVQDAYPFHEPLPNAQIPDAMVAQMVQHRFRTSEGGWPLIQIGPGIMTVNETDSYTWDDFKNRCAKAVANLFDAHPAKQKFTVQDLTLRYIDAVEVDFTRESVFKFLQEKMKTNVSLPDELFDGDRVKRSPTAFNWQASFPHDDPGGLVTLRFAVGQRSGRPALIWETLVQAARERIPAIPDGFSDWLGKAHDLTDDWFFKLIKGELEMRFSGE
ncbi:MAG: TIGR04255 family protein [Gammaproteobacteria bacterium]